MTSPESTADGSVDREVVFITGSEHFRLIHELLDPTYVRPEGPSGRTTRLALKYVEIALKVAPARVLVEDHFPSVDATRNMIYIMGKLFDTLGIDYEVRRTPSDKYQPRVLGERVRNAKAGDVFEVIALPPSAVKAP